LIVRPIPPFRLDLTVWALRRRARNTIDRWDGVTYRRVLVVKGRPTEIAVRQEGPLTRPRLIVTAAPSLRSPTERQVVVSAIDKLLGLRIDLREWYRMAEGDQRLRSIADRFRGVKPPRFPTVFEALVNGFACQQLSLVVGLELLNRLAAVCDVRRGIGERAQYAFPAPRDVARIAASRYHTIGFSRQKVEALLTLARRVERGEISVERLALEGDEKALAQLGELRGVGRWTAEYVLLRGLGRLHVFPGDDVGAQKNLARWLGRSGPLNYDAVSKAVKKWHPYAGMLYFHLLLDGLSKAGVLGFSGADAESVPMTSRLSVPARRPRLVLRPQPRVDSGAESCRARS